MVVVAQQEFILVALVMEELQVEVLEEIMLVMVVV